MSPPYHIPDGGNWLKVCIACNHDPSENASRPLLGERLADQIQGGLQRRWFADALQLRRVQCLAGCQHPSTVVLGAIGKCKLRLHAIGDTDTEAILDVAEAYVLSRDGTPDVANWPEHLKRRLVTLTLTHTFRGGEKPAEHLAPGTAC